MFAYWQIEDITALNNLAGVLFCNEEEIIQNTSSSCIENKIKVESEVAKKEPNSEDLEWMIDCSEISKEQELINSFLR